MTSNSSEVVAIFAQLRDCGVSDCADNTSSSHYCTPPVRAAEPRLVSVTCRWVKGRCRPTQWTVWCGRSPQDAASCRIQSLCLSYIHVQRKLADTVAAHMLPTCYCRTLSQLAVVSFVVIACRSWHRYDTLWAVETSLFLYCRISNIFHLMRMQEIYAALFKSMQSSFYFTGFFRDNSPPLWIH